MKNSKQFSNCVQIEKPSFINKHQTIHNNLNDNLLLENIKEFNIYIDSDDRKIQTYPNAYNYVVSFKSDGRSYHKLFQGNNEFDETPSPVIIRTFKNVKYVRLNHVLLSDSNISRYTIEHIIKIKDCRFQDKIIMEKHCSKGNKCDKNYNRSNINCIICKTQYDCYGNLCDCNCCECSHYLKCELCFDKLEEPIPKKECLCKLNDRCHVCNSIVCKCYVNNNKFLILRMKELKNNNMFSTNTLTSDNSFILHYDRTLGSNHNIWKTEQSLCVFPTSLLYNLNRLSVEFCDNRGELLNMCIIIQYSIVINTCAHKIILIFGLIKPDILKTILTRTMTHTQHNHIIFQLNEIYNIDHWYKMAFDRIMEHISCETTKCIMEENYTKLIKSINGLEINNIVKCDITNNVFLDVGIVQNELNTMINYE